MSQVTEVSELWFWRVVTGIGISSRCHSPVSVVLVMVRPDNDDLLGVAIKNLTRNMHISICRHILCTFLPPSLACSPRTYPDRTPTLHELPVTGHEQL